MAFQSHRTRFKGDLAGIAQEKIVELDYTKENISERLEYVNKKYSYMSKYHEEYTSEYYKVNLNADDNLSADINVFKAIEKDANYLLNSLDIPRESQYKYNLLTQEEFDEKIRKEKKADLFAEDGSMDVMKPAFKNDYINMDLKIAPKDLVEDSEMGKVLRDYDVVKQHLRTEMFKIKSKQGSYLNVSRVKMMLGTINCDMLDVKKSYKGITRPSSKLGDIGSLPDYDAIKYSNPAHIKAIITCLKFGEIEPDSVLSHIAYDVEKATKAIYEREEFDLIDMEIIEAINSGISMNVLQNEIGISKQAISKRFNKICEAVAMYYTYFRLEKLG